MPYLTPAEVKTHMFQNVIDAISDGDETYLPTAIKSAQAEAYGYLSNYDRTAIFAATNDDRNPILLLYVKDIAVWHFIQLANPNIDMQLRESRYKFAVQWLEKVQNGKVVPDLPVPTITDVEPQPGALKYGYNPQRKTHY